MTREQYLVKLTYAGESARDYKQISKYEVINAWPKKLKSVDGGSAVISYKTESIPLEELTDDNFLSDEDIVYIDKAALDASIVVLADDEYDKLTRLFSEVDLFLFDPWTDIPKSGLGTICSL